MPNHDPMFYNVYRLSLLSFILAAAPGALFRYGLIYSLPEALELGNIRHAHTHLMFFNWPGLFTKACPDKLGEILLCPRHAYGVGKASRKWGRKHMS